MEKIGFVPWADVVHRGSLDQHAGAGDRLDRHRHGRQRFLVQQEIGKQSRRDALQPGQAEGADERASGRREGSPAAGLLGTVGIAEHAADHADGIVGIKHLEQARQRLRRHGRVRIEEQQAFGRRRRKADVAGCRKTEIAVVADDSQSLLAG